MRESTNNYKADNGRGYIGRYQMGELALQDAGFMDAAGKWTKKANYYGVYTTKDFLNTPKAQDAAIQEYHEKVCGYIQYYELDSYIGTNYCGVTVTHSGLLASCHLVGVGAMRDALSRGSMAWDGNKVAASDYMRMFGGYDVSSVW